ncbi:NADH-ubiquinone oxidoreductase assembly factor N7BML [Golovinomyces cichoracearum]|uniref:NADH-ubiquinone oxidoreductase assembly factor N7BML n=1 Tax=Golovinomyces cichoracearum TaxID=62708 RepID=A0A420ICG0_9PEZI|nr:NADH-ubiquinone oxidoreductase assembly factor N7BML [Golovinomyces cichoracearum]
MSSTPGGRLRGLWNSWKSLKLPWRKRFLAGLDLHGNTFWEFRDTLSSHQHRMRRLVKYSQSVHHSDIQISPQWHQWLRHARADPPSLAEQSQDALRQEQLKFLVAAADARWESKSKLLDTKEFPPHQILTPFECRNSDGHPETSPKFATCENGKIKSNIGILNKI